MYRIMKKVFVFIGVCMVAALAGAGAALWVVGNRSADIDDSRPSIERTVERMPVVGSQFTTYQAENYPDLT